jgi:hypothetical protein
VRNRAPSRRTGAGLSVAPCVAGATAWTGGALPGPVFSAVSLPVAPWGSARIGGGRGWGASGRWFKSSRPDSWKAPRFLAKAAASGPSFLAISAPCITGALTRTGTPNVSARSTSARKSSRSLWSYTAAVISGDEWSRIRWTAPRSTVAHPSGRRPRGRRGGCDRGLTVPRDDAGGDPRPRSNRPTRGIGRSHRPSGASRSGLPATGPPLAMRDLRGPCHRTGYRVGVATPPAG